MIIFITSLHNDNKKTVWTACVSVFLLLFASICVYFQTKVPCFRHKVTPSSYIWVKYLNRLKNGMFNSEISGPFPLI